MGKAVVIVLAAVMLFSACGQDDSTDRVSDGESLSWQEQYDLGMSYLSEGNYAEAIIAFTAAIEIDPKQIETYLGLSTAYVQSGDDENALRALETGYADTNDEALLNAINELLSRNMSLLMTENMICVSDLKIGGNPIDEATIADFIAAYPDVLDDNGALREYDYGGTPGIEYRPSLQVSDRVVGGNLWAWAASQSDLVAHGAFRDGFGDYSESISMDFNGISMGNTFQEVLVKFGLSESGMRFFSNKMRVNVGYTGSDYYVLPQETDSMRVISLHDDDSKRALSLEFDEDDRLVRIQYDVYT